jgi:TPP-dependent 2-oxoacid decarboxylase
MKKDIRVYGCGNWGSLGAGFGMSVGATFAKSENPTGHVYCVTGDGAFLMAAQELSTLIEHQQDYTIIILDNAGYGAERQIWPGKERTYNNFAAWNFELLPEAFGGKLNENCYGFVARTEKEFDAVLREARVRKGVKVIRAVIDRWDTASFNVKMSEAMRH